jgi:hypothetical protein
MLAADYQDQTIKVLQDLRTVFENRYDQLLIVAKDDTGSFEDRMHAYGCVKAYGAAIDDVILALHKERAR